VLWLGDLKWRDGRWIVDPRHVHETGLNRHRQRAIRECDPHGPHHRALLEKVQQYYRILLTRALKGVHIWFEDRPTREHVLASLGPD
jgi:DUF2075 family protein